MTEPDKTLKEALFRSHQATEKANQAQDKLYNMSTGQQAGETQGNSIPELHESPRNLLQSWDTLRQLDEALEDKKPNHERKS
ncbi:hypothetical protein I0P70_20965 [Pontibacter sp. FD36]|uniref:hypothetical protein n=1 Tax=Pontibacter sp. FD36 TaxID=2789860 RepID=UPI0018A9AE5D|nr:hypothetical protein [Pontibacter sp. FD36]MBF8965737.1 hypothetical protein [Pontibacter sp. FD36]